MLFLLLPFLNPLGMFFNCIPAVYLAFWPVIGQTLGRDALVTHALVFIMFILICDTSRQLMFRAIGFDLLSPALGIGFLLSLTTDQGAMILNVIKPIFSSSLVLVEPLFLIMETVIIVKFIKSFNKMISGWANERDEEAHDLSAWEAPLSRKAVLARFLIIILTISSYLLAYHVVLDSKSQLMIGENSIPSNFHHAIAVLVTLQVVALSATIYKDNGVISESATICLAASIPIWLASWSYHNMLVTTESAKKPSLWESMSFGRDSSHSDTSGRATSGPTHYRFVSVEIKQHFDYDNLTFVSRKTVDMVMDSLDWAIKTSVSGFGSGWPQFSLSRDFWLILAARCFCVAALVLAKEPQSRPSTSGRSEAAKPLVGRRTLIKCLFVVAYAQMILQRADNSDSLSPRAPSSSPKLLGEPEAEEAWSWPLAGLLRCLWGSTVACAWPQQHQEGAGQARSLAGALSTGLELLGHLARVLVADWLGRCNSQVVQRLAQSVAIQAAYLCSLGLLAGD